MPFVVGSAMILLAILVEDREMVAAALVGFGAALMTIGVRLSRPVGPVTFGAEDSPYGAADGIGGGTAISAPQTFSRS